MTHLLNQIKFFYKEVLLNIEIYYKIFVYTGLLINNF